MDTEREIIYLAICNQIQIYSGLLEQEEMDPENKGMAEYILNKSLEIEEKLREEINQETTTIKRPKWNSLPDTL